MLLNWDNSELSSINLTGRPTPKLIKTDTECFFKKLFCGIFFVVVLVLAKNC